MKLVRQINNWTCLPAAVATSLFTFYDDPLQEVFNALGHDGSELVRVDADPFARRGFHPQEMIQLAWNHGWAVTQIDMIPSATPSPEHSIVTWSTVAGINCEQRFGDHLKSSFGWIDCRTRRGTGHALAYDYATIGDPSTGETFTFTSRQDTESRGLYLVSLFRFDKLES